MSNEGDWKGSIGIGIIILSVCLGVGGCTYLVELGIAKRIEAERQTITITNSFNHIEKKP